MDSSFVLFFPRGGEFLQPCVDVKLKNWSREGKSPLKELKKVSVGVFTSPEVS